VTIRAVEAILFGVLALTITPAAAAGLNNLDVETTWRIDEILEVVNGAYWLGTVVPTSLGICPREAGSLSERENSESHPSFETTKSRCRSRISPLDSSPDQ
jgi:hypothetical protein